MGLGGGEGALKGLVFLEGVSWGLGDWVTILILLIGGASFYVWFELTTWRASTKKAAHGSATPPPLQMVTLTTHPIRRLPIRSKPQKFLRRYLTGPMLSLRRHKLGESELRRLLVSKL